MNAEPIKEAYEPSYMRWLDEAWPGGDGVEGFRQSVERTIHVQTCRAPTHVGPYSGWPCRFPTAQAERFIDLALAARSASPVDREDELGAAWAAAEEALPEGWELNVGKSLWRGGWYAYANQYQLAGPDEPGRHSGDPYTPPVESIDFPGAHPTPAAALRALASALTARSKDPSE